MNELDPMAWSLRINKHFGRFFLHGRLDGF